MCSGVNYTECAVITCAVTEFATMGDDMVHGHDMAAANAEAGKYVSIVLYERQLTSHADYYRTRAELFVAQQTCTAVFSTIHQFCPLLVASGERGRTDKLPAATTVAVACLWCEQKF